MTTPTLDDFRKLRTDCGRLDVSVSKLLERARAFAEIVNDQSRVDWMSLEQTGYAMAADLPDYRSLPAVLTIKAGGDWRPAQWISSAVQRKKSSVKIRLSVDDLQTALDDKTTDTIGIPIDGSQFKQHLHDTVDLRKSRMDVAKETIDEMLGMIRLNLREWIAAVDKDVKVVLERADVSQHSGKPKAKQRIFIVHGHDTQAVERVENVLIKLGYEPISLQKNPAGAETIIQRLDRESDVVFAIILLTPDDLGGSRKEIEKSEGSEKMKKLTARARQNVIFEYGYFIKKLSPGCVFPLKKGDTEQPSNLGGTTPYDFDKEWERALVTTMKKAGLDADFNKLL